VSERSTDLFARCAVALLAVFIAGYIASKRAPSAANSTPIPTMPSASAFAIATGTEVEEVAVRFTEHVGDAHLDAPNLARGLVDLQQHWRRMQAPWRDTSRQPNGKLVQLIALRQSATETAHVITTSSGSTAVFDVRKWNTSEGAFAQREAIVAPTPATLKFHVRVPVQATLEIAPAVLGIGPSTANVTFIARAGATEIGRVVVHERDRWNEKRFDLGAFAGKEIDLELVAEGPATAIALWGTPRIVRRAPSRLPYNVLWIVVDSLRPDVLASFHNLDSDAAKRAAKHPPGDTLLPIIEGLTPNIDALAKRSSIFRNAISPAPWTRPGTIAMLSGVHSREVGLSPLPWILVDEQVNAYYRAEPPLFPLAMRRAGASTRAFVNNNFMLGYAAVGVDMGFEHVEDYRYRTLDTAEVTRSALEGMRAHANERFFHFVNYNSPHEPFEPPAECLARVPGAVSKKPAPKKKSDDDPSADKPKGPTIDPVKSYMAEACKDDAAIGTLLAELDRLGLREKTIVVLTADHGETLSERHDGVALDLDAVRTRFHHAFGMWEETTRIPILLSLPGVIPEGRAVDARVTNLDLAPTLLKLLGLERDPRQGGIDLVAAARTGLVPARAIVTFGRGSSALFHGKYRFVVRDQPAQKWLVGTGDHKETLTITHELYDLVEDPGETRNLAALPAFAGLVEELRGRLAAASKGIPTADDAPLPGDVSPALAIRFAGGGAIHRVHATITAAGATSIFTVPFGIEKDAILIKGQTIDIATSTAENALVGFDLTVSPPTTPIHWTIAYDDKPLGDDAVFGGVLGVSGPGLAKGILDGPARTRLAAGGLPFIDPTIDRGAFVVRLGAVEANAPERTTSAAAAAEVKSALQQWGYAK
jgi:arylsulfatase A-like enzyme